MRTVQGEVKAALQRLLGHPLQLIGASRTDTGVHARGQVANVYTSAAIPACNLRTALSHRLPPDIEVVHARDVAPEFHATRHARAKLYRYRIWHSDLRPVCVQARYLAWHIWTPLNFERLSAAAEALVGRHDFAGFASAGSPRTTTVRTVRRVTVRRRGGDVLIDVLGDGFLYNQVRNMVGTLVEIGRGHWPVERIAEILQQRDRRLAGPTAPPHGLCLQWVKYGPTALPADSAAPVLHEA